MQVSDFRCPGGRIGCGRSEVRNSAAPGRLPVPAAIKTGLRRIEPSGDSPRRRTGGGFSGIIPKRMGIDLEESPRVATNAAGTAVVTGIADYKVSDDPQAQIVAYALGSCLGITFYHPGHQVGAVLHAMLPDSTLHRSPHVREAMFVDTGVPVVLDALARMGCRRSDLQCKVFGGAQVLAADGFFRIGRKNIEAFSALSNRLGLNVSVWEVGGCVNHTIRLLNHSGAVVVKVPARPDFVR